ncbi:hypothetical protein Taro_006823 [Colocasia esculenta]|uniref:Uncharacterized protein n=1 Tax=Colocasia esculenta TaxID=4460 RepID=A0A843TTJ0_COLES|nr:hypothetical protein [Colocasia esculenta]
MWRSSCWLRSCGTPTPSRSSSPSRLLRPAQTVHLKSTKDPEIPQFALLSVWGAVSNGSPIPSTQNPKAQLIKIAS